MLVWKVLRHITAVTVIKEVHSVTGFEAVEWTQLARVLAVPFMQYINLTMWFVSIQPLSLETDIGIYSADTWTFLQYMLYVWPLIQRGKYGYHCPMCVNIHTVVHSATQITDCGKALAKEDMMHYCQRRAMRDLQGSWFTVDCVCLSVWGSGVG